VSLLPFFRWCDGLAMSVAYRESLWLFPVTQALHLVAVALFAGAILVVDMRLLGALAREPRAKIARNAQPWLVGSFGAILATGIPQFTANAMRYYGNAIFWWKMELVLVAVIFTLTLRRRVAFADEERIGPGWARAVGLASLVLWAGVTIGGRAIGFY
jgi:hypothetical protein